MFAHPFEVGQEDGALSHMVELVGLKEHELQGDVGCSECQITEVESIV